MKPAKGFRPFFSNFYQKNTLMRIVFTKPCTSIAEKKMCKVMMTSKYRLDLDIDPGRWPVSV